MSSHQQKLKKNSPVPTETLRGNNKQTNRKQKQKTFLKTDEGKRRVKYMALPRRE